MYLSVVVKQFTIDYYFSLLILLLPYLLNSLSFPHKGQSLYYYVQYKYTNAIKHKRELIWAVCRGCFTCSGRLVSSQSTEELRGRPQVFVLSTSPTCDVIALPVIEHPNKKRQQNNRKKKAMSRRCAQHYLSGT